MSRARRLSNYIVAAVIAGLVATTFSEFLLGWPSSRDALDPVRGSTIAAFSNRVTTVVDRTGKGDRAPFSGIPAGERAGLGPVTDTTIVPENIVAPQSNSRRMIDIPTPQKAIEIDGGKPVPAIPEGCEALASSIADPTLGRLIGRCLA